MKAMRMVGQASTDGLWQWLKARWWGLKWLCLMVNIGSQAPSLSTSKKKLEMKCRIGSAGFFLYLNNQANTKDHDHRKDRERNNH